MESILIDTAKRAIAETCVGVKFSIFPPIYIPIKDNKIEVSTNVNSLENADECMLILPYIWNKTVPSNSGLGTVTYIILSIDNEGNVIPYRYGNDSSLWIDCGSKGWSIDAHLKLNLGYTTLYQSKNIIRAEEEIYKIWDMYQTTKKIMDIMNKDFDDERAKLQSKTDELTRKYSDLKKKNKILKDTVEQLKDNSD